MTLTLLDPGHNVLQEVDGHLFIGWQVVADVDGEEVVDFSLAPVSGIISIRMMA